MTTDVDFSEKQIKDARKTAGVIKATAVDNAPIGSTGFYVIRSKDDERFRIMCEIIHEGTVHYLAFGR